MEGELQDFGNKIEKDGHEVIQLITDIYEKIIVMTEHEIIKPKWYFCNKCSTAIEKFPIYVCNDCYTTIYCTQECKSSDISHSRIHHNKS